MTEFTELMVCNSSFKTNADIPHDVIEELNNTAPIFIQRNEISLKPFERHHYLRFLEQLAKVRDTLKLHKISSENVFVVESNQCKPMVIENITVYEYDLSDFERRWLSAQYLETLQPQIHQYYEIYVPEGTFVRKYNLT